MAPGAIVDDFISEPVQVTKKVTRPVPKSIFPDGIRTSGQQPPIYELLKPYSEFPKHITGPTVWKKEDYIGHADRWIHAFTDDEVQEISDAADKFIESGIPLTGIAKVSPARVPEFLQPRSHSSLAHATAPSRRSTSSSPPSARG